MIYQDFQGLKLSSLGLGALRFPILDGNSAKVDLPKVEKMVANAIAQGVNYFDTAWAYHGGMSETVIGQVLSAYPRESYYLADKFPGNELCNIPKVREIFEAQLKKCGVEYFDFYLFHNVCEMNVEQYMDEQYGIFDYLMEQKRNGRIRHLGFSAHGSVDVLRRFLEKYGHAMEFGQLQVNWLDWEFQNAKGKYELLQSYHIPVWVMEPLRGGKLCKLPEQAEAQLRALRPDATPAEWGFRFLQGLSGVTMVLSGMSDDQQVAENTATFSAQAPLTEEEKACLLSIARDITSKNILPCTACRYCTSHCPKELDIPRLLELYNENLMNKGTFLVPIGLQAMGEEKHPSNCIGCRGCEQVCPQDIKISEVMRTFAEMVK